MECLHQGLGFRVQGSQAEEVGWRLMTLYTKIKWRKRREGLRSIKGFSEEHRSHILTLVWVVVGSL
jgi:hypothetical protein